MTYFEVLAVYIGAPLLVLFLLTWRDSRGGQPLARTRLVSKFAWPAIFAHVVIALVYTSPWDNYLVATEVWWYDSDLVTGITIFWVPIEEYTFFIVQTLMTGLLLLALSRYAFPARPAIISSPWLRFWATGVVGLVWLGAIAWLLAGWQGGTYLGLILAWALIPIMVQLAFGADILWARFKLIFTGILITSTYLNVVDALAIRAGTWTISPEQTTGILIGGILPVEEAIFFFITNVLIVFGVTLMLAEESQARARAIVVWIKRFFRDDWLGEGDVAAT